MKAGPSETEVRIMVAAERIFLASGFSRVSMDELAAELGMSKKTVYARFSSKDALVLAMIERRVSSIEESLKAIVGSSGSFLEKFRELAHLMQARTSEVSPAFLEDIRRFSPEGYGIIERFRARAIPLYFGCLLDEGIREGYLVGAVPRAVLIRMLVVSIQGIVRPDVVADLKIHPTAALDHILSIIFGGILTAKGRRACSRLTLT